MKLAKLLTVLCIATVFAFALVMAAGAQSAVHVYSVTISQGQIASVPSLDDLLTTLKNLGGVALLFAALTNVGKKLGWVTDGNAPAVSLGMNTFGLAALVFLQLTGRIDLVPAIDSNAGSIANVINAILALVFQLYVSRKGHDEVLAGLPVVGKSFSGRRAGNEAYPAYLENMEVSVE